MLKYLYVFMSAAKYIYIIYIHIHTHTFTGSHLFFETYLFIILLNLSYKKKRPE